MVNTLVMYDIPRRASRQKLETVLRGYGFVWLFPNARWSSVPLADHGPLLRQVRYCLRGEPYRLVFIEMPANHRTRVRWLSATRRR